MSDDATGSSVASPRITTAGLGLSSLVTTPSKRHVLSPVTLLPACWRPAPGPAQSRGAYATCCRRTTRLIATDLNPPMLDVARKKFHLAEPIEFQHADAMALPFANASFDAVVCQFSAQFFPDKEKSYREAYRVLAPGGPLCIQRLGRRLQPACPHR